MIAGAVVGRELETVRPVRGPCRLDRIEPCRGEYALPGNAASMLGSGAVADPALKETVPPDSDSHRQVGQFVHRHRVPDGGGTGQAEADAEYDKQQRPSPQKNGTRVSHLLGCGNSSHGAAPSREDRTREF